MNWDAWEKNDSILEKIAISVVIVTSWSIGITVLLIIIRAAIRFVLS